MPSDHPSRAVAEPAHNGSSARKPVRRFLVPNRLPEPINPALLKHAEERASARQNRVADAITTPGASSGRRSRNGGLTA